jgi:sterol desaturase/sphingolipid hydroxylase (fatty acid hydroxylase superfamily)
MSIVKNLTLLKDNLTYISIITGIWYYSEPISNFIIEYTFTTFIIVEIIYWSLGLLCWLLDTKQSKQITELDMLPTIIRNHIILGCFSYLYVSYCPPKKTNISNGLMIFLFRLLAYLVLYDIIFYTCHKIMHHKYIYKFIHKQHHLTYADSGISGYYMGVFDFFGEFILPFFLPLYVLGNDPLVMLTYGIIGQINGVLSHSGHKIPFMPYSKDHLIHHTEQKYNYGIFFMDYIFQTNRY